MTGEPSRGAADREDALSLRAGELAQGAIRDQVRDRERPSRPDRARRVATLAMNPLRNRSLSAQALDRLSACARSCPRSAPGVTASATIGAATSASASPSPAERTRSASSIARGDASEPSGRVSTYPRLPPPASGPFDLAPDREVPSPPAVMIDGRGLAPAGCASGPASPRQRALREALGQSDFRSGEGTSVVAAMPRSIDEREIGLHGGLEPAPKVRVHRAPQEAAFRPARRRRRWVRWPRGRSAPARPGSPFRACRGGPP